MVLLVPLPFSISLSLLLFSLTKFELPPQAEIMGGMTPGLAWPKAALGLCYPCLGSQRKEILVLPQHPHVKSKAGLLLSHLGHSICILRPITVARNTRPELWDYS